MKRGIVAAFCAAALMGCGADEPVGATAGDGGASDISLPACGKPPSEDPTPPPAGALTPPGSRLTAVRHSGEVTQLNGYVESDPTAVREWIETQPDLDVVATSQTPQVTELLVTDGTWRTFISVRAVCADGSLFAQVIARQDSDAVLPSPDAAAP